MPKKKLSLAERKQLLEDTKQRLRLQQEARTIACERLGRQLQLQHLELSGELECSDTDTARQYTLYLSDCEEDLTTEESRSSTNKTYDANSVKSGSILETPD